MSAPKVNTSEIDYQLGDKYMKDGKKEEANRFDSRAMSSALPYAQEGRADEQVLVGKFYRGGKGVTQDYIEAEKWFQKATDQGDPEAKTLLAKVASIQQETEARKIREQQAAEAQKLREQQAQAAEDRGDYDAALLLWWQASNSAAYDQFLRLAVFPVDF
ncbi:MAG: hypothetical protein Q8L74_10945 [Nitrospirota bacterium]|nr:hypothetical protein [Nitrospirota bacterium]MDP2383670.1 hypothetical protein [Nitrospirota bacterium]MDP3598022.1 hypothetical protein [Nitrospirota bacterium]